MLLFFPKTPSVALKKMHSPPPPLRSPPGGGQHFKPFKTSRRCPCLGRPAEGRAVKKSLTTALNHHTLPSAHTAELKPSEAKKCTLRPLRSARPPVGGSTFKPITRIHSPLRSARPPVGGSTLSRSILETVRA